ncbi:MAG: hypothetical protein ACI977_000581 [Candidatus Nanohaloarchaea archaeon]
MNNFTGRSVNTETSDDIEILEVLTEGSDIVTASYESMELLEDKAEKSSEVITSVLEGAEYDFHGFEKEIIEPVPKQIL